MKNIPLSWAWLWPGLLGVFLWNSCQPVSSPNPAQLKRIAFRSQVDQSERDFFLYLPKGYESTPTKQWPVLFFLHGNGERGDAQSELDYVLIHGPLYETWIQKRDLPFIIVAPQLPMFGMDEQGLDYIDNRDTSWIPKRLPSGVPARPEAGKADFPMLGSLAVDTFPGNQITLPVGWDHIETDLINILEQVLQDYQADANRVYLSGISYGGFGTWWMASQYPDRFAAIAPIVGWGHPSLMAPIAEAKLPLWVFAGGRDQAIEVRYFYRGLNELERLGHPKVRFTIHADSGHDAWRRIYAGEDVYNWLLDQHRSQ